MGLNIHATCIDIAGKGVLFTGSSGAGKSDMALRLIAGYKAILVADDRVDITVTDNVVTASAPAILRGLLEVRHVGIIKLSCLPQTTVNLVVELTGRPLERMPEAATYKFGDVFLPLIRLNPFELSAPAKVLAALSLL